MGCKMFLMNWQDHISFDPGVCHGKPCVKGTRVMVSVVLDNLAAGVDSTMIIDQYPVNEDQIRACLAYAADLARDRVIQLMHQSVG